MVAVLFVALGLWWYGYKVYFAPAEQAVKPQVTLSAGGTNGASPSLASTNTPIVSDSPVASAIVAAKAEGKIVKSHPSPVIESGAEHNAPEEFVTLSNDNAEIRLTSWGAGVVSVTLKNYRQALDKTSPSVVFDLTNRPALAYSGIPGLSRDGDFRVTGDETGRKATFEKTLPSGLEFVRTITLGEGYQLQVAESFKNKSNTDLKIPACELLAGQMRQIHNVTATAGYEYMGIDSLLTSTKKVLYWAGKGPEGDTASLVERFQPVYRQGSGCTMFKAKLTQPLPVSTNIVKMAGSDWVALKNKFFVQILAPKAVFEGVAMDIRRSIPETESATDSQTWSQTAALEEVSAAGCYRERDLKAGDAIYNEISFYAGPKEYAQLKLLGNRQEDVMEFGYWLYPISKLLLVTLNFLYKMIPNYGVAVILLTILVRIIFWPVTHKSTESMKEMQKIQPLVNQVREKYKDKPERMNKEVMALYKEHKVNPLSGCLPILVQIPVFIALFTVLRSAVELRFSEFLWIKDLSEPENLLAGIVPYGLNILPILMSATMFWQQKMTPTAGDPQQQKMMLYMMPIMMLFMFYTMASALVLYWTVSQVLSIYQLYRQKGKAEKEEAAEHAKA